MSKFQTIEQSKFEAVEKSNFKAWLCRRFLEDACLSFCQTWKFDHVKLCRWADCCGNQIRMAAGSSLLNYKLWKLCLGWGDSNFKLDGLETFKLLKFEGVLHLALLPGSSRPGSGSKSSALAENVLFGRSPGSSRLGSGSKSPILAEKVLLGRSPGNSWPLREISRELPTRICPKSLRF